MESKEFDSEKEQDMKKIVSELLAFDQTYDATQEIYRNWATSGTYDYMLQNRKETYAGPFLVKTWIQKLFENPQKREQAVLLDLGAGSGQVGEMLIELGFKNIHALEPCKELLDITKEKGIYQKTMEQVIGGGSTVDASNDTYDAIVTVGTFCPGHIPCDALHEIVRILKPGGYFINCMREEFITEVPEYKDRLLPLMEQLVTDGKWKKLAWERYDHHYLDKQGIVMVFEAC